MDAEDSIVSRSAREGWTWVIILELTVGMDMGFCAEYGDADACVKKGMASKTRSWLYIMIVRWYLGEGTEAAGGESFPFPDYDAVRCPVTMWQNQVTGPPLQLSSRRKWYFITKK